MNWFNMYNKLGRQPMKNTRHDNVHAIIPHPVTGEPIYYELELKFDKKGKPYLTTADYRKEET